MLDLRCASSLPLTLLCSLICIPKCHSVFPFISPSAEDVIRQTTWVDEQVMACQSLWCLVFSHCAAQLIGLNDIFKVKTKPKGDKVEETALSWRTLSQCWMLNLWFRSRWFFFLRLLPQGNHWFTFPGQCAGALTDRLVTCPCQS